MPKVPIDPDMVIDVYRRAADENRADPIRKGSTLYFPNYGQLVMTGDLHGHLANFDKLVRFCVLGASPGRHVILHELIHPEEIGLNETDHSHELLYEVAHWKCAFPDQVHFLQSNHELAQLTGQEITKNGREVTREFEEGLSRMYGRNNAPQILEAIKEFISSMPLAGRTPDGIFLCHSLPAEEDWPHFDRTVLDRMLTRADLFEGGPVYQMTWGRRHSAELLNEISLAFRARFFITGHQPREEGFGIVHDKMLILASDHNHGVFLPISLNRRHTLAGLVKSIRYFVAVP